jgi:hypothetical protein
MIQIITAFALCWVTLMKHPALKARGVCWTIISSIDDVHDPAVMHSGIRGGVNHVRWRTCF